MTIDEAIAHARAKAQEQRYYANFEKNTLMHQSCVRCAKEHEQLAEWLEELKEFKNSMVLLRMYDKGHSEGYNKAIDDFKSEVKYLIKNSIVIRHKDVDEIAEQLKGGGEDD